MFQENRKESRIGTHIIAEIEKEGGFHKHCGYIENLSKDGMGIISLEPFRPGETVISSFYLNEIPVKINSKASLVHSEMGDCNLYYHGFKFDDLSEKDQRAIENFVKENQSYLI